MLEALRTHSIIIDGEFTLKSGKKSTKYVDLKKIISFPELNLKVCHELIEKINPCVHCICGTPYGAVPFTSYISIAQKIPMLFLRKEPKTYGTKKVIEGHFTKGNSVVLIEDVVTTGQSVIDAAQKLEEAGLNVTQIICVVSRSDKPIMYKSVKVECLYCF